MRKPYRWTEDSIFKEARKYKYKFEWRDKSPNSYAAARRLGIKQKVSSILKKMPYELKNFNTKWSPERKIFEDALKYKTSKEWRSNSPGAYAAAVKKGILKKVGSHFEQTITPKGFYNKSYFIKVARKYNYSSDWMKKEYNSYASAIRLGYAKDKDVFGHFKKKPKIILKWTKENILKDAAKYDYVQDWRVNSAAAEGLARTRGWHKEATKHMQPLGNFHKRCLYSIKVKNEKKIYIGITYRFNRRIKDHLKSKRFMDLKKYYGEDSLIIKQITKYLPVNQVRKLEIKLVESMKQRGFEVLNIAKAGAIGGTNIIWTREKILKEVKKYKNKTDWKKFSDGSFQSALRNRKLFDEATKHMPILRRGRYTDEELINDAKKYKSVAEWSKKSYRYWRTATQRDRKLYLKITKHLKGWQKERKN